MSPSHDQLCGPTGKQLHSGGLQEPGFVSNILYFVNVFAYLFTCPDTISVHFKTVVSKVIGWQYVN